MKVQPYRVRRNFPDLPTYDPLPEADWPEWAELQVEAEKMQRLEAVERNHSRRGAHLLGWVGIAVIVAAFVAMWIAAGEH